eukprot:scaffold305527_cov27-Tisochrysis_lutea.AAC.1
MRMHNVSPLSKTTGPQMTSVLAAHADVVSVSRHARWLARALAGWGKAGPAAAGAEASRHAVLPAALRRRKMRRSVAPMADGAAGVLSPPKQPSPLALPTPRARANSSFICATEGGRRTIVRPFLPSSPPTQLNERWSPSINIRSRRGCAGGIQWERESSPLFTFRGE